MSKEDQMADYQERKYPAEEDWNIIERILAFQSPEQRADEIESVIQASNTGTQEALYHATAAQDVVSRPGAEPRTMAVEFTRRFVETAYEKFVERIPPAQWGRGSLPEDFYLGGWVDQVDIQFPGGDLTQVERMVLKSFSLLPSSKELDDWLTRMPLVRGLAETWLKALPLELDMTKAEIIRQGAKRSIVYWRVFYSHNDSVVDDIGSLEFRAHGDRTQVTFHSAHDLNLPDIAGIELNESCRLVQGVIGKFFVDTINGYRKIATA